MKFHFTLEFHDEISRYIGYLLKINLETHPETRTASRLIISNETGIHNFRVNSGFIKKFCSQLQCQTHRDCMPIFSLGHESKTAANILNIHVFKCPSLKRIYKLSPKLFKFRVMSVHKRTELEHLIRYYQMNTFSVHDFPYSPHQC